MQLKCKEFFQNIVLGLAGVDDEALAVILRDKRVVDWSRPTYILGKCFPQSCVTLRCRGKLYRDENQNGLEKEAVFT